MEGRPRVVGGDSQAASGAIVIRTPDQRVRVFVSSALRELAAERRAAEAAITQLRLTPVLFELGARPYAPRDLYRAYLKQSDVFVGIYAESYGWVAPGMEVSGLEDEYRLSADKPRLIYAKKVAQREPRLTSLLEMIRTEGVVSYRSFEDASELGSLVADDLALLLTDRFAGPPAAPPATLLPLPRWPLVDRVEELQVVTGLLVRADAGLVTLTAWSYELMIRAEAAHLPVDAALRERLATVLTQALRSDFAYLLTTDALVERATALYALAAGGKLETAYASELARTAGALNTSGLAMVVSAIAATPSLNDTNA